MGGFKGGELKLSGGCSSPPARVHDGIFAKTESLKYAAGLEGGERPCMR